MSIILTIILGILITLFCIASCIVASECEKLEQKYKKKGIKK